jgi:hypothetical protein
MKQAKQIYVLVTAILLCSLLFLPSSHVHAFAAKATTAKTNPPPVLVTPFSIFDPSFEYLSEGESTILDNGDQTARINVSTIAKTTVSSIGATIYLEKWTGSQWIEVSSKALNASNRMLFSGYAEFNITSGYYYRARTTHWTSQDGVYEHGESITSSILAI